MRSCCNDGKFLELSTITLHPSPICLFAVTLKRVRRGREVTVGMERKRRHPARSAAGVGSPSHSALVP